jgi:hypothetical protein
MANGGSGVIDYVNPGGVGQTVDNLSPGVALGHNATLCIRNTDPTTPQ